MIRKLMSARRFIAAGILMTMAFAVGQKSAFAQAPPVPDHGWTFDDKAGTTAAAKFGSADGELSGGATWSNEDPFGGAGSVSFDGTDGTVVMEDLAEAFNGLSNFSLSMWIKANEAGIDKGFFEAVDSGGADAWGLRYDSTGASAGGSNVIKLGITTSEAGGDTNRGADQQETKEDVQTTEWQHLLMTWEDGVGFNLYIDGVLDEPTLAMVTTAGTLENMDRFVLGDGAKSYWDGAIDEVAVWTSTLSADHAAWLASNSIAGIGATGGAVEISFTYDFDGGLPDGSDVAGSAEHSADEGVDGSGALVLTRNIGSQRGGWLSENIGTVDKFKITFDIYIADGTDTQADGLSMAISDDLETVTDFGEEGPEAGGSKLIVCFDNWDNGDSEGPAIDIKWGKEIVATVPMGTQAESTLDTEGWWPVEMELTLDGDLTISYNDELIHDAVNIPDFESIENARIAFGGRTGGANANQFIDNFKIVLQEGSGPAARSLEEGLIGYWPFDDKSDTTEDISEAGNVGTLNGSAEFVTGHTGKAHDSAIQFDGTDSSVTTEIGLLNDLDELTLSFWILMPEQQAGNRVGLIGQNDAVEYGMINPTTMQYWTPEGSVDTAFGPTVEEWTHVAVVVDGAGMRVYSNGEMIGENPGAGGAVSSGDTFNMGGDGVFDADGNWFLGSLDDVAVWNIGLSDDDIADLASGAAEPIPVTPAGGSFVETVPGLIAYWPFDGDLEDAVGDSHGTEQGTESISYTDGRFGEGISLDGVDQFVETPLENEEMFDFQDGTGFSISAWFTVDSFTKGWQALIAKGEGNRWRVHRRGDASVFTANGGSGDVSEGSTDVSDGSIHHIAVVSDPDGGEVRFYVDGEIEGTAGAPNIESNDFPMMIGENPDARNRTWHGMIDDVGFWARPITEDEIATIYNGGTGNPLMKFVGGGAPPALAKFIPNAAGFVMNVKDGSTTFTDKDLSVSIGGVAVENVTVSSADGITSIRAALPSTLVAGSEQVAKVNFSDSGGSTVRLKKEYTVPAYSVIIPGLKAAGSLKGGSGFVAYATQISLGQSDLASVHGGAAGALEQFLGLTMDSSSGDTFLNEADGESFDSWTYFAEVIDVINQTDDLESDDDGNYVAAISGKFNAETGHPDDILTGIESSWDDTSTDGYVNGYLALLDLTAGAHTFGLNVKNGYIASIGPDFGASAGSQVGGAKKTFNIFVEEAGLYPLQVLFYESAAKANIELYSIVNGVPVLVNDSNTEGSIKAYTIKGAETGGGVEEIVSTGRASIVSVLPSDGSTARSGQVKVVVQNASTSVKEDSVQLTLNGEAVEVSVSKDGDQVTISYDGVPIGPNTAVLSYGESDGSGNQIAWSFDYAAIYASKAPVPTSAGGGITVHEYSGTGGSSLANLFGDENFPNTPTRSLVAGYFEWPQTGDIEVQPAGDVWNNYGLLIMGYIHPPETGEYFFYGSSDDNMETWLSTDSDPANAKLILRESGWRNPRQFQAQGEEETSGPIFLEAGKAYYVEMIKKEGGGGDNAALAWSTPEDEGADVEIGGLPISGDYLSPYIWTGPQVPELGATSPTGILGTTEYDVSVNVNNGETVKVAEFTKLEVGGESLLGEAEVSLSAVTSTIKSYGDGEPSTELTAIVEWKNDDGSTGSGTWSFMTSPHSENALYIEAEDFNYDGGEWYTFEDTVGGGMYEGLGFVADVDIHNSGNASENYRVGDGNHPGMADSLGFDGNRGDFDMDVDYKMGWNDAGDWYNYTRDFAAKETYYNVIGRFSSGGSPVNIDLSRVTGDTTATDQTTELLGNFSGPATACWDCMEFFPLKDAEGNAVPIKIGGETTLRLTILPGSNEDMNYMMFVPSAIQEFPPTIVSTDAAATDDGAVSLTVVLTKREQSLSDAKLSVNGKAVDTAVATDGDTITLTGNATGVSAGAATATVSFNGTSTDWAFSVPYTPVNNGDGTITFQEHVAWEWWDGIGGAHPMEALTDNARYPDSPDGATFAPSWNTRTALAGGFDGNGRENYGGRMSGILTAPESGTYRFFIASDDHGLLRISTDADPANAVRVAEQTGCCNNFALDDGGLSGTVDLVEGQQYYMESLLKEGGGGDWMTVGWRMPSEDIDSVPAGNQEGIPGKYFAGKVTVPALPALSASVSPGNDAVDVTPDGSITLNITEGATTVVVDTVSISLNGTKLEHTAAEGTWSRSFSVVTQEGKTHTITAPTGKLGGGSQNAITVTFTDSAGTVTTIESSFRVKSYHIVDMAAAGTVKYIEAEDFDFDGGSHKTFEEVGTGGSYEGLGFVADVDIHNNGNSSEKYRVGGGNHPGMTESMWDSGRNGFSMEVDFKMGWNDEGDWYNYTRDFPEGGTYAVFGRFSSGGNPVAVDLSVVTDGQGTTDQTLESVGTFTGPATGGWDTMKFFPLNDEDGELASVSLSGTSTVRLTILPGNVDMNYLAFVPYEQAVLFNADPSTVKYIEAEDFNFDGGSFKTFEEVGTGGSYEGLGFVADVDIHNNGNASEKYRVGGGNHPGMTESMWDAERGGGNGFSMEVDFKMGWNDEGDWYNYTRDFPEGGSYAVYGRFSSGGNPVAVDLSVVTAGQGTTDQTLESVGTFTGPSTGGWDNMEFFPLKDANGNLATVGLSGESTVRLTILPGNVDMNYLAFVPYVGSDAGPDLVDISAADDTVVPTSDNHPAGEHAGLAFDNDSSTKYLNFDGANDSPSGLTITTGGGVVSGLGLTSANDAPDRDPATFVLSGSNDGGATFTEIASGDVPAFGDRFERQEVSFANDVAYTTYELIFPTTAGPSTCCMQIAEIELLGTAGGGGGGGADAPALSVVNNGDGTVTITFEGTLQAGPTVNGPWENVDAPSPLTIPADQAQQYGRAVTE